MVSFLLMKFMLYLKYYFHKCYLFITGKSYFIEEMLKFNLAQYKFNFDEFISKSNWRVGVSRGGVAQWIGRRISDQGVPGSIPRRCTFRCGLEQVTFTLCLVLVKPRKRWTDDRLGQTVTRLEITLCLMC